MPLTELLQRAGYKSNKEFTDAIGVGATTLYNWKNGEPIKSSNLKKACITLRVSLKTFLAAIGDTEDLDKIPDDDPVGEKTLKRAPPRKNTRKSTLRKRARA